MLGKTLLAALLLGLVGPLHAAPAVHEYTLDNGLKLIVKEDHRAPVVVSQIWYKVGASYEHNGITGISHVLEHMMFQGTKTHPPGEFSRIIASQGGRENAFTSRDYTAYFQQLEKERLAISFELEADRMRNLLLNDSQFQKERRVVIEERRLRTEDNPQALTGERFNAVAYLTSPYRNPTIGWADDLRALKLEDLQSWYDSWYAPNNATLVVVGDVRPDEVLALAKKHFGPIARRPVPPVQPPVEIKHDGPARLTVRVPAELPYLVMGYQTSVLKTAAEAWEPYALEVLAGVLDGGASARFARELVRGQQVAAGVGAGYDLYARGDNLFTLSGTPAQGRTIEELEKALHEQVRRVREEPVTAAELERVKAQVVAGDVYEKDSVFYQAMQIGTLETVGLDWRLMDEYVDRIKAVTADQVQKVAQKYLKEESLTVAVLDPLPLDPNKPRPQPMMNGGDHVR